MSEVFIYRRLEDFWVTIDFEIVPTVHYQKNWYLLQTASNGFTYNTSSDSVPVLIPLPGKYAYYKSNLLPINATSHKTLLMTDLDGTLFLDTAEGISSYSQFEAYWISNYEFTDSLFVINTGRPLSEYLKLLPILLQPDLLITTVGNYAYQFDLSGSAVQVEDYDSVLSDMMSGDWDSDLLLHLLTQKFPQMAKYKTFVESRRILMIVPDKFIKNFFKEMKSFVENQSQEVRNGKMIIGRTFYSKQWLVGKVFLEILPKWSTKYVGVVYTLRKFGLDLENTLVAGDSINDKEMLKHSKHGVIVRNAENALLQWFHKRPRPQIYHSSDPFASGIIDGLSRLASSLIQNP